MTPEEINIAIALDRGWQWYRIPPHDREPPYRGLFHPSIHEYEGQDPIWLVKADGTEKKCAWNYMQVNGAVPDYFNSKDDLHDVLVALTDPKKSEIFEKHLDNIVNYGFLTRETSAIKPTWMASAAEEAEAYVLMLIETNALKKS